MVRHSTAETSPLMSASGISFSQSPVEIVKTSVPAALPRDIALSASSVSGAAALEVATLCGGLAVNLRIRPSGGSASAPACLPRIRAAPSTAVARSRSKVSAEFIARVTSVRDASRSAIRSARCRAR